MDHIELFGCTGAGKTTLSKKIFLACKQEGINLLLVDDYLLSRLHLDWIQPKIFRLLFIDSYCMAACLLTTRKNLKLYQFCIGEISKLSIARMTKINLLRNILKGIGTHEIIKKDMSNNKVVLVDGGTFQSVQPLFVHNNHPSDENAILAYSKLLPLPDYAIYFDQPDSLLKERIKKRGHKRISTSSDEMIEDFINKAKNSYELLIQLILDEGWMSNIDSQQNILISNHSNQDENKMNRILEIITEKLDDAKK